MIRPAALAIIDAVIAAHATRWTEYELLMYRHRIASQIDADIRAAAAGSTDPYVLALLAPTSAGVSLTRADDRYEVTFTSRTHRLSEVVGSIGPSDANRELVEAQRLIDAACRRMADPDYATLAPWAQQEVRAVATSTAQDMVTDARRRTRVRAIEDAAIHEREQAAREAAYYAWMSAVVPDWRTLPEPDRVALRRKAIDALTPDDSGGIYD